MFDAIDAAGGAAEVVSGFKIYGLKGIENSTFYRNIFAIEKIGGASGSMVGLGNLSKALEAEALASGASKIEIIGSSVHNSGFANPAIARRYGYSFTQLSNDVVVLSKQLR